MTLIDCNCDEEAAPLIIVEDELISNQSAKNHRRDVHILSAAFLLVFLSYGAAQNLQTTVNSEGDLGTRSLGILYTSFAVFSLVASMVVRSLGTKTSLILGTTGYWLFVAANLKPTMYTMYPASLYLGFCSSIIWVGQGTHLTSIAHKHARVYKLDEGSVIGEFNGEFWGIFAFYQVFGNLIVLLFFGDGTDGNAGDTNLLFLLFLFIMTFGSILMFFLHNGEAEEMRKLSNSSFSVCNSLSSVAKSIIAPVFDVRMLLVIPLMAYSGLQLAFVWAEFTKEIVSPALGVSGVGGAMAVYGVSNAICSFVAGRFTSGIQSIILIVSGGIFVHATLFLWILLKYSLTGGVLRIIYPLVMAGMLGFGDGVFMTQLNALLSLYFKNDMEGAFARLKVWQCGSIAIVFFVYPYISLQAMLIVMLAALCITSTAFFFLMLGNL